MDGDDSNSPYNPVWPFGHAASPLGRTLGVDVALRGRVPVQPDLSVAAHPDIFVIGDLAAFKAPNGTLLPGIAPVAIQQGQAVAENIWRSLAGQPRRVFHYFDRGTRPPIGLPSPFAQI